MTLWQEGDILGPTNLNTKGGSATTTGGFSTNTLRVESGNTLSLGSYALEVALVLGDLVGPLSSNSITAESGSTVDVIGSTVRIAAGTATEVLAWGGTGLNTTYGRLVTNNSADQYGMTWNFARSTNTQDDPSKPSWRFACGYGAGDNAFFASYASAGMPLGFHVSAFSFSPGQGNVGFGSTFTGGAQVWQMSGATMQLTESFIPASGTASGQTGDITWGSGFIYVCTSTNSWRRATLAAF